MNKFYYLMMAVVVIVAGCGKAPENANSRTMYISAGGQVKTMDPALASDLASRNIVAAFYDTLLQYNYTARPYQLEPAMLAKMPEHSPDFTTYTFTLRDDLYFQNDPCFVEMNKMQRKITARDVIFSYLRIADGRLHSPVFWMFRGKIKGIDTFMEKTALAKPGDFSFYDTGIAGLELVNDTTFKIHLNNPDPRFLYSLAIPYASIVSRRAAEFYGDALAEHPVGSGPFRLIRWIREYRITLERNPEFRRELFEHAQNPADRVKPLPLLDKIVCYQIRQPLSAWLMFLQGNLDMSALDKNNLDAVVDAKQQLISALAQRGIQLFAIPAFEIRYVGFNFTDPVLASNLELRRALSLAYDIGSRVRHFNYQLIPAQGPIPPGVSGYDREFKNPWVQFNVELAKEHLRRAGYPDGIDPQTNQPLTLTFDLSGNSSSYRQLAELMERDMRRIGIKIIPALNSQPRFFQKMRQGKFQLFLLSWIGDYPDAENFLQLFYGRNAGSSNRAFFQNNEFDVMYEKILNMPDSPERSRLYREMVVLLTGHCPWIFEGYPISFQLTHSWLQNFIPHDFAFAQWKYLSIDINQRGAAKAAFKPIELRDLRK
jgi:ABC-type transport system substrate-binding protein